MHLAAIVLGVGLLVAGCGGSNEKASRICRVSGTAEICLVSGPSNYKVEGSGFQPRSEATLTLGGAGQPLVVHMDGAGRVQQQGSTVGILGGPDSQQVVINGTTSGGSPAAFELTVPPTRH